MKTKRALAAEVLKRAARKRYRGNQKKVKKKCYNSNYICESIMILLMLCQSYLGTKH